MVDEEMEYLLGEEPDRMDIQDPSIDYILKHGKKFISETAYLVPVIDDESNDLYLGMYKLNDEKNQILHSDKIMCIHTAVMKIPVQDFVDTISNPDFQEYTLNIRSSEDLEQVYYSY